MVQNLHLPEKNTTILFHTLLKCITQRLKQWFLCGKYKKRFLSSNLQLKCFVFPLFQDTHLRKIEED